MPRIKELREGRGWSQERLAREASQHISDGDGITSSAVKRIERTGRGLITNVQAIALALEVTVDELMGERAAS